MLAWYVATPLLRRAHVEFGGESVQEWAGAMFADLLRSGALVLGEDGIVRDGG